jgi:hypothetical protein
MTKPASNQDVIDSLFVVASELSRLNRPEVAPIIRRMIRTIEKIGGPLDDHTIDSWSDFADPLIAKGFIDATPGYYFSVRPGTPG